MPEWRNGSRARLKIASRKGWRFKSSLRHKRMKKKVLVIVGPTASGKSDLGVRVAKKWDGEVISADSRQVYKYLNIGTGKISKKEQGGIKHHLLNVLEPKKRFSASQFKELGLRAIEEIRSRDKLPVIVGGTGFYIDTLRGEINIPEVPENKKLREKLNKLSVEKIFDILQKKDPQRAKSIDKNNKVRLIRALEIIEKLGYVPKLKKIKSPYQFILIGLKPDNLEEKIKTRLLKRLDGMIREAKKLIQSKKLTHKRMQELGLEYRFLSLYLKKKISKEEMVKDLDTAIKQYAKRQITWFKRNKKIKWFKPEEKERIEKYMASMLG